MIQDGVFLIHALGAALNMQILNNKLLRHAHFFAASAKMPGTLHTLYTILPDRVIKSRSISGSLVYPAHSLRKT
jgi:hypothetical protein